MRITLLANRDLYSNFALNHLVKALSVDHSLTLCLSQNVGPAQPQPDLRMLAFYEQTLPNRLWFPLVDAVDQKGELLTFQGLAAYLETPPMSLSAPNSQDGLLVLANNSPDLIVSVRFGHILKSPAIAIPRLGVLNLHSGKLPAYRGVMATFRALLNQDVTLGTTLHWIDSESIDSGPIISQQSLPRDPSRCYLGNVLSLYEAGCSDLLQTIRALSHHQTPNSDPAPDGGAYYSFPNEGDICRFNAAGHQWVDPNWLVTFLQRYRHH